MLHWTQTWRNQRVYRNRTDALRISHRNPQDAFLFLFFVFFFSLGSKTSKLPILTCNIKYNLPLNWFAYTTENLFLHSHRTLQFLSVFPCLPRFLFSFFSRWSIEIWDNEFINTFFLTSLHTSLPTMRAKARSRKQHIFSAGLRWTQETTALNLSTISWAVDDLYKLKSTLFEQNLYLKRNSYLCLDHVDEHAHHQCKKQCRALNIPMSKCLRYWGSMPINIQAPNSFLNSFTLSYVPLN